MISYTMLYTTNLFSYITQLYQWSYTIQMYSLIFQVDNTYTY